MKARYDVVILGAGHNGLVAAAYLGRAGLSVLVLEKAGHVGGAAVSESVFPDYDARLSRYAYLVSLLPERIIKDLGLTVTLRRRATASFTPYARDGKSEGLLLSNVSEQTSRESLRALTGTEREFEQMGKFYHLARLFAEQTWDSLLEPLRARAEWEERFSTDDAHREAWRSLVEQPLGQTIERYLGDDLLRGVVFTDAKIGLLTHPHDASLLQNRCFLYHLIGNKTGEWKVPIGGMGQVTDELARVARAGGAEILTRTHVVNLEVTGAWKTVECDQDGTRHTTQARFLLSNFGRNVLAGLARVPHSPSAQDEGSVFKINMLCRRLPRLKSGAHAAAEAFAGTFHVDEGYAQMQQSYAQACRGELPQRIPAEVYCHTLTDDSILGPKLREQGFHTLTLFGLDTPWRLFQDEPERMKRLAERRFLDGLNAHLAEPLEDCLARDAAGRPCLESKSPIDLENELGLFRGNIFQAALQFPFAESSGEIGAWGVETEFENVFLCGASARRGGGVSGIPGHNAAMKVMRALSRDHSLKR